MYGEKGCIFSVKKNARQSSKLSEETPFSNRMADSVGDPFDEIDSGDEDPEKPPTPEIHHHGGDSPDAPGFSDISDNEGEERTKEEARRKQSEDSNDSGSVNSPVEEEVDDKEDGSKQEKENIGSPLYDQEMSPVSSTSATAEEHENTSGKVERDAFSNDEESSSLAAQKHAEETLESESKQQHLVEGDVEGEDEVSSQPRETGEDASEEQSGGTSNATENAAERRRTISSGAITDDDLEMPISPLGLGLSGTESELVDDILKSDVSKLLPDIKEDSKEDPIGIIC